MMRCSEIFIALVALGNVFGHMKVIDPPTRNSIEIKTLFSLDWRFEVDYNIAAPLGEAIPNVPSRPFPCVARQKGRISRQYKAGQLADIAFGGDADHNGGHCQLSISYDEKIFVAIGNIYNNCTYLGNRKYKIKIPETAPEGDAVLAWTWINRTGQLEFYMLCADVYIKGRKDGYIDGHDILLRKINPSSTYFKVPADKKTAHFPAGFQDYYGVEEFFNTQVYRITRTSSIKLSTSRYETAEYISLERNQKAPLYNSPSKNIGKFNNPIQSINQNTIAGNNQNSHNVYKSRTKQYNNIATSTPKKTAYLNQKKPLYSTTSNSNYVSPKKITYPQEYKNLPQKTTLDSRISTLIEHKYKSTPRYKHVALSYNNHYNKKPISSIVKVKNNNLLPSAQKVSNIPSCELNKMTCGRNNTFNTCVDGKNVPRLIPDGTQCVPCNGSVLFIRRNNKDDLKSLPSWCSEYRNYLL